MQVTSHREAVDRWQEKKAAVGLCNCCGKYPAILTNRCAICALKTRERLRTYTGCSEAVRNGRGRPPKFSDAELRLLAKRLTK